MGSTLWWICVGHLQLKNSDIRSLAVAQCSLVSDDVHERSYVYLDICQVLSLVRLEFALML